MIQITDLTKVFAMGENEVRALDGVSFSIDKGEMISIMGPSGSGKSTLMHILGCLSRPTSGQYILDGQDISDVSKNELAIIRNEKLGFIFQAYNLLPRTDAVIAQLVRLAPLAAHGLVHLSEDAVTVTDAGWYVVRAVAMVFDRYLAPQATDQRFSRIV